MNSLHGSSPELSQKSLMTLWHTFLYIYNAIAYSRSGFSFKTYLESGYSTAVLMGWVFYGSQAVFWPLSLISDLFAQLYYISSIINIYVSFTWAWCPLILWLISVMQEESYFIFLFNWQVVVEFVLTAASVAINGIYYWDIKAWYYDYIVPKSATDHCNE